MIYICARHRDTRLWNTFVSTAGLPEWEWELYPVEAESTDEALSLAKKISQAMQQLDDTAKQLMLALALETQHWRALNEALKGELCIQVPEAWELALLALQQRQLVTMVDPSCREVRLNGAVRHYRPDSTQAPRKVA